MAAGKTRTRQHRIADLAVNHVERQILLCGHTVERVRHDYGYDLIAFTYNERGEVEVGVIYFQVKATENLPLLKDGMTITWPVSRRDLILWLREEEPVILVVYDASVERAWWLHLHRHFADRPTAALFAGTGTLQVHIPLANRVNPPAIRKLGRWKNELHRQIDRDRRRHD